MFLQHALFALQRMPAQQSNRFVQLAPAGAQHCDDSQVKPEQQSVAVVQEPFTALQQVPPVPHVACEQQGVPALHAVPSGAQHWPRVQLPVQHWTVSVQLAAAVKQGPHWPPLQIDVPQQSP